MTYITTLQMFLEGKNMSDTVQIWIRDDLKWTVTQIRNFVILYGVLCTLAGMYLTPAWLKGMTARGFTTATNATNTLGFFMRGLKASSPLFLVAMLPMLPGVNGASATALKARATDLATAQGIGKGEFSAWINNLRALVGSIAPVLYGQCYARLNSHGVNPGLTYIVAGTVGAVLPQLIL